MRRWLQAALLLVFLVVFAVLLLYRWYTGSGESNSNDLIYRWLTDTEAQQTLGNQGLIACPDAPFILPSTGLIGLLWRDPAAPYSPLRRHTGVDIFGTGAPGTVAIYAAYDGWLTRLPDWRSTVIIRHDDPLQAGRVIWTYYTHMANRGGDVSYIDAAFPAGTTEVFVQQGTLLGYQGEFAGNAPPIAMHLHFSIVTTDGDGNFLNEAQIENTLDPSPYLGMPVGITDDPPRPVPCL